MAIISYSMRICYTRCVKAPGHGKKVVDGLIGTEKTYADSIFARPDRQAEEDAQEHDIGVWCQSPQTQRHQSPSYFSSRRAGVNNGGEGNLGKARNNQFHWHLVNSGSDPERHKTLPDQMMQCNPF
jgi:hypothetical protein